jgi:hypothetical protein
MHEARVDPFEREIQRFLTVFPEFSEELPMVDDLLGHREPTRIATAKGTFGMAVWLRAQEAANPKRRDAVLHGFLEENPGADALYQAMYRRITRQARGAVADQLPSIDIKFPSWWQWREE